MRITFAFSHDSDGRNIWSVREHLGMVWEGISDHVVAIKHDDQLTPYEEAVDITVHVGIFR